MPFINSVEILYVVIYYFFIDKPAATHSARSIHIGKTKE